MDAAVGHSHLEDPREALDQVRAQVGAALGGPADWGVLFATSSFAAELAPWVRRLGCSALVGGSTTGVITCDGEHAHRHGVGLLAVRGVSARARLVSDAAGLRAALAPPAALRVVLADPRQLDPAMVEALGAAPHALVGGGVTGDAELFVATNQATGEGLMAACAVNGLRAQRAVAQGAEPVSAFMPVTRARGSAVLELGGVPATLALRSYVGDRALPAAQLPNLLFAALRRPGEAGYAVRPIVGIDEAAGALRLFDGSPSPGTLLAFAWRESLSARRALEAALAELHADPSPIRAALYFNCAGRGEALHPWPDADVAQIRAALPGVPLLGMSSAFELAPVDARNRVLMYAGVLVALRDP